MVIRIECLGSCHPLVHGHFEVGDPSGAVDSKPDSFDEAPPEMILPVWVVSLGKAGIILHGKPRIRVSFDALLQEPPENNLAG
jgi:hypothetical protein